MPSTQHSVVRIPEILLQHPPATVVLSYLTERIAFVLFFFLRIELPNFPCGIFALDSLHCKA